MKFFLVDAFAVKPFTGAQSAVYLTDKIYEDDICINIAEELNAPETIFVSPCESPEYHYTARIFRRAKEVKSVGHTLFSAAHVIWQEGIQDKTTPIYFETVFGIHKITYLESGEYSISLSEKQSKDLVIPDRLTNFIGAMPISVSQNSHNFIIELHSEKELRDATPDVGKLATIDGRKFILTAESEEAPDIILARVYYPQYRNDEEPVSLDCYPLINSFWSKRLDTTTFKIQQISGRETRVETQHNNHQIMVSGQCITTASGVFHCDGE